MFIDWILLFFSELFTLTNDMSPYLLLGFLIAGILHIVIKKEKIVKYLGGNDFRSVVNAAIIGIPLPLCSCGVIPTGVSFYKEGASKSATVSFLIATPQTGVDSILVTYSMLGLPFAIIRPIIALFSGLLGGIVTNIFTKEQVKEKQVIPTFSIDTSKLSMSGSSSCGCDNNCSTENKKSTNKFTEMLNYAFVEFMEDIAKWLIIGLLLATLISVLIPDNFFSQIDNSFLSIGLILLASIPLYICATSSVPLAAVLLLKGLSPGAVLVFLMAGPATNIATLLVLGKSIGKKTTMTYLFSIVFSAVLFGLLIDFFLPKELFFINHIHGGHNHDTMLPFWIQISSTILLTATLINALIKKNNLFWYKPSNIIKEMNQLELTVTGMTCNHCKASVEKQLTKISNVENVSVTLSTGQVIVDGKNLDKTQIISEIESLGYGVK